MGQQRNTGVVYCITNQLNGKQYVGITGRSLQQRFAEHCKADSYIGKAIRKHGVENFTIKEIDEAETKQDLREKEMMWIEKLGTFGRGYNLTIGGDGVSTLQKLNLELTDKQSKFLRFVEKDNENPLDVNDAAAMVRMVLINVMYCYLKSEYASEKRQAARMILRYKKRFKDEIFRANVFSEEEVMKYAAG